MDSSPRTDHGITPKRILEAFTVNSDSTLDFSDDDVEAYDVDGLLAERVRTVQEGATFCHVLTLILLGFVRVGASLMLYFSVDLYKVGHSASLYLHNTFVYMVFFGFFVPVLLSALYVLAGYAIYKPEKREKWRLRVAYACFGIDLVLFGVALRTSFVSNAFGALALILALPSIWTALLLRPSAEQLLVGAVALALFAVACLILLALLSVLSFIF